jgi:hypothetical protein
MIKFLAVFLPIFYVALNSAALGAVPNYIQIDINQMSTLNQGACKVLSAENIAATSCEIVKNTWPEEDTSPRVGEENSKPCVFHIISLGSTSCVVSSTQKRTPILTRRLVPLKPFSIEKPPRSIS